MAPNDITENSIIFELFKIAHRKCHSSKSIEAVVYHSLSVTYPAELLNSLGSSGLSPHKLDLKFGATIMILRDPDPPIFCNGTRLLFEIMMPHIIKATILSGYSK